MRKAVDIDPDLPEVHAAIAGEYYENLNFQKAYDELSLALNEEGKSSPFVLRTTAYMCQIVNWPNEAVAFARKAAELDPLQGKSLIALCLTLHINKQYGELTRVSRKALELFPENQNLLRFFITSLIMVGDFQTATGEVNRVHDIADRNYIYSLIYFKQNDGLKLDSIMNKMDVKNATLFQKAEYYAAKKKFDTAFELLEGAIKSDGKNLILLRSSPFFDLRKDDIRYAELMRKYSFPVKPLLLEE